MRHSERQAAYLKCVEYTNGEAFACQIQLRSISQSALSRHISILETELGAKLMERTTHNVELTPIGLQTSLKFRDILAQYDALLSEEHVLSEKLSGDLSLGLLYYGVAEYYSDFLNQFSEKYTNRPKGT